MENNKERFTDFVEAFKEHVEESNNQFIISEEESGQVLKSKLAKNIDIAEKIDERFEARIEKHEVSIQKSLDSFQEKMEKNITQHEAKLQQLQSAKEKSLQAITNDLEKEKSKLEKALVSLESNFVKEEKKCLSTIEKQEKKAETYNIDPNVSKTEKDLQHQIKNIQQHLSKSLESDLEYSDSIKEVIIKLMKNQASLEKLEVESKARIQKLKHRVQKDELTYEARIANLEQTKLREELKSKFDLDKLIKNYEYSIAQESLKTKERKVELDFKLGNDTEELRFYEHRQELKRDRLYQIEKEHVSYETIHQKDRADKVKNNYALSSKEHKNLFIFEKSLNDKSNARELHNYKLSVEEIDSRSKQLLERVKISIAELKTILDAITTKVKSNLKIELKMPTAQVKIVEEKYKQDNKELEKEYAKTVRDIKGKLVLLDSTFDHEEIKELNTSLQDLESKHKKEVEDLSNDVEKIISAYKNKISYANDRSNKILDEAQKLYDKQLALYNKELSEIKHNAEQEKKRAKELLDNIQASNNGNLTLAKEINDNAVNQNDELVTYLAGLTQANIDSIQSLSDKRNEITLKRFESKIKTKKEWFSKNETTYNNTISELENKLNSFTVMMNKKLDAEKRDVEKYIQKLESQLKSNLQKASKEYNKIDSSYKKAMKDAELVFSKENKNLLDIQTSLREQLNTLANENNVEVDYNDFDIFA